MIATQTNSIKKTKKLVKKRKSTKTAVDYSSDSEEDQQVLADKRVSDENEDDHDEDDDDGTNDNQQAKQAAGRLGLANALAKVLRQEKPKNKKHIFLSKSKKLHERVQENEEKLGFEIDGEIKEEKPIKSTLDLDISLSAKKNKILSLRMKPSLMDREREKAFKKIATKGVVQLFNAVRIQQKDLAQKLEDVGPLDHRKDAVLNNINKKKFLDVLMGGNRAKSELVDNPVKDEIKEESDEDDDDDDGYTATDRPDQSKSQWDVLRNDFMTNKKMTHWDKDEDDEEDNEMNTDNGSDSEE